MKRLRKFRCGLVCLGVLAAPIGFAEEEGHSDGHGEGHGKYALAGFVGGTHGHGSTEFTYGIEAGMNLSDYWSIGAVLEQAERDRRSRLLLLGIGWHPSGGDWRIQLGLGRKNPVDDYENVLRLGLGYEFVLENHWFVKPYLALDFVEHDGREEIFGLYFGRSF
jgi:hypothetical protein